MMVTVNSPTDAFRVDSLLIAAEMAAVGAIVTRYVISLGQRLDLAGTPAVTTGQITREQFLDRVEAAGLHKGAQWDAAGDWHFYTISTD